MYVEQLMDNLGVEKYSEMARIEMTRNQNAQFSEYRKYSNISPGLIFFSRPFSWASNRG